MLNTLQPTDLIDYTFIEQIFLGVSFKLIDMPAYPGVKVSYTDECPYKITYISDK